MINWFLGLVIACALNLWLLYNLERVTKYRDRSIKNITMTAINLTLIMIFAWVTY